MQNNQCKNRGDRLTTESSIESKDNSDKVNTISLNLVWKRIQSIQMRVMFADVADI